MYFPKSQLQTDLYTNGSEFMLSNSKTEYIGDYFIAQGNLYFSGKNPNDKPNLSLTSLSTNIGNPESDPEGEVLPESYYLIDDLYYWATNQDINEGNIPPTSPTQSFPLPSESDYKIGEFDRFFLKKINEVKYIEVLKKEYEQYSSEQSNVSWRSYTPFKIPWEITGNRSKVFNTNKNTVNRIQTNLKLPGFKSYFRDKYDQFFKYTPQENLYTQGNEFKLSSNGQFYIGYYHTHPEKGPMVGRQHTKISHDFLIPVSGSNYQDITTKIEPKSKNYRESSGY